MLLGGFFLCAENFLLIINQWKHSEFCGPQWNFKSCQQIWVMIRSKRKQLQATGYLRKLPKKPQLPKADL